MMLADDVTYKERRLENDAPKIQVNYSNTMRGFRKRTSRELHTVTWTDLLKHSSMFLRKRSQLDTTIQVDQWSGLTTQWVAKLLSRLVGSNWKR